MIAASRAELADRESDRAARLRAAPGSVIVLTAITGLAWWATVGDATRPHAAIRVRWAWRGYGPTSGRSQVLGEGLAEGSIALVSVIAAGCSFRRPATVTEAVGTRHVRWWPCRRGRAARGSRTSTTWP